MVSRLPPLIKADSWKFGARWWDETLRFWTNLKWRIHPSAQTSIVEIAFLFWMRVRAMPPDVDGAEEASFGSISKWIRMWVKSNKSPDVLIPSVVTFLPRKGLRLNQAFGFGTFDGGRPFASKAEMVALTNLIASLPNRGAKAKDWDCGVSVLP